MAQNSILLIGGSNIDYIATASHELVRHNSNIGTVEICYGGVMRNITENLCRIGNKCIFITVIGNDAHGTHLKKYMEDLGCTLHYPKTKYPTSSYIAINNQHHDMEYAINDMRIMEELNPEFLEQYNELIENQDYIILDSNLSSETLDYLFTQHPNKRFLVEGISEDKIVKFRPFLSNIYMLKCNIYEAETLMEDHTLSAKGLALKMMEEGCISCVISQGKDDICFGFSGNVNYVPVDKVTSLKGNTTGCGDALFAGIIDQFVQGKSLEESIIFGKKLSRITLDTYNAVNPDVSSLAYKH